MRKKKSAPQKKRSRDGAKSSTGKSSPSARGAKRKAGARKADVSRKKPRSGRAREAQEAAAGEREVETVIGSRELVIRGYWDRYPSSDQRKHHKKYDAIEADQRRGPTAYDLLVRDYNAFTASERRNLRVRVVYGIAPDTGNILSPQKIAAAGMSLDLHRERSKALLGLQTLLVRSGVVDSPKEWRVNQNAKRIEHHVPLGIVWSTVKLVPAQKPAKKSPAKKAKRKKRGK